MYSPSQNTHKPQKNQTNEQQFVLSLAQMAIQIMQTLQNDKDEYETKMNAKQMQHIRIVQQLQKHIEQLKSQNESLDNENKQLRLKLDQSLRHFKRNQMNVQLLNNKIKQLLHQLTEKEAVIRYLESKNHDHNHYLSKKSMNNSLSNANLSLEEPTSNFREKNLSFAKLKENKLKFQDYANKIQTQHRQNQQQMVPKNKTKRIKTEQSSYEIKQNKHHGMLTYNNKLNDLLNSKLWTSPNDKTLSKRTKPNDNSFWIVQNGRVRLQSAYQRRSTNLNNTTYLYKPDNPPFPSQLHATSKQTFS